MSTMILKGCKTQSKKVKDHSYWDPGREKSPFVVHLSFDNFSYGFFLGLLTLILTNPIWVTKTRLCLQYEKGVSEAAGCVFYNGTLDALIKIYKMEGIRGLYKVSRVEPVNC